MDSRLILPANIILDSSYRILRVVGTGGFGITYEAEDTRLGTMVAVKEYYPFDFGDRDATMSVRPKSERHKQIFERGRSSFLQEARTLARFEHPSIVRVTRVFEWNSNAYMVMRFERGLSFDAWLRSLGRPPSQEELDAVTSPMLDALETMHAADFLHRDIAPDNIVVRADGTPVLLDFGAARRAVAEMSRTLTGIVKAGYSPHEQYATDGRLQGPWSDFYAFGATLYRAVTGHAPEEATLRVTDDRMPPAGVAARGTYRPGFLSAIDACLKVNPLERPQSVAQLRPMLLEQKSQPKATEPLLEVEKSTLELSSATQRVSTAPQVGRRWFAAAALTAVLAGGSYSAYEYRTWRSSEADRTGAQVDRLGSDGESRRRDAEAAAARRQAMLDAETRKKDKEAADARQRQIEIQEEQRRKEIAETQRQAELAEARRRKAEADAEAEEKRRIAALEETRRKDEAAAALKREEEVRIAALEEAHRSEEKRKEDEHLRLAAIPDDKMRADFVRKTQEILKRNRCYDGAVDGRSKDTQSALDRFVENAAKKGNSKPRRIELAKATVGLFETWLKEAGDIGVGVCVPLRKPEEPKAPKAEVQVSRPQRQDKAEAAKPQAEETPQSSMQRQYCGNLSVQSSIYCRGYNGR